MKIYSNYYLPQNQVSPQKPTFKRSAAEHASWGANLIKEKSKANFKLFSFPDAKAVFVEVAKKSSNKLGKLHDRIAQIIFAQGAITTYSALQNEDNLTQIHKMEHVRDGVYTANDIDAEEGSQYRFIVVDKDKNISLVKDPYSKQQPDINGWSEIYSPDNYDWKYRHWLEGKDPRRIVRNPNEPMRGLENLIIEEINIPTLSEEGTFEGAKKHIDKIARKKIATAIEIMPVENTFSLQWGYDGVDKFAVNPKMGTQAELKELIDYAHGKGLNVIIDMVPNHIGPDGNYLEKTGPYIGAKTPWGDAFNYKRPDNKYVRDYMANIALWWLNEFKADGLRLDMTKHCDAKYLLKQIVDEVNYHNPLAFLIAEDGNNNDPSITNYRNGNITHEQALEMIDECSHNIAYRNWDINPNDVGFDSEWDFVLLHEINDTLTNSKQINLDQMDWSIRNSQHRVKFLMSHDEIGNLDGTRFIPKIICNELNLFDKVDGANDAEKGQKAAHLSQKLAELCVKTDIEKIDKEELHRYAKEHGMSNNRRISAQAILTAFNIARAKNKLGLATMLTIPGPKMYFQGDDELNLSRFKFFRDFSDDAYKREHNPEFISNIMKDKGYDWHEPIARKESLINSVEHKLDHYSEEMLMFTTELTEIIKNSEALTKGIIINTFKDINSNVHTHHLKSDNEEILVIKHFGHSFHNANFNITNFPKGNWKEIFNSDSAAYGGSDYVNTIKGTSINAGNQNLNLAPNSVIILKRV